MPKSLSIWFSRTLLPGPKDWLKGCLLADVLFLASGLGMSQTVPLALRAIFHPEGSLSLLSTPDAYLYLGSLLRGQVYLLLFIFVLFNGLSYYFFLKEKSWAQFYLLTWPWVGLCLTTLSGLLLALYSPAFLALSVLSCGTYLILSIQGMRLLRSGTYKFEARKKKTSI